MLLRNKLYQKSELANGALPLLHRPPPQKLYYPRAGAPRGLLAARRRRRQRPRPRERSVADGMGRRSNAKPAGRPSLRPSVGIIWDLLFGELLSCQSVSRCLVIGECVCPSVVNLYGFSSKIRISHHHRRINRPPPPTLAFQDTKMSDFSGNR